MKVGSSFMLNATPESPVELRCGEVAMFTGRMGRKGNHIAIRVDQKLRKEKA
jgi:Surface presentation of antigens (SPOA).